jgi:hypothetical protein
MSLCFLTQHQAMEAYWGVKIYPHTFVISALDGGEWSASRFRPLYPQRKRPRYPLDRRLGESQSRSGRGLDEKNSQHMPGLEPPIVQPVDQPYTTELSRLLITLLLRRKIRLCPDRYFPSSSFPC